MCETFKFSIENRQKWHGIQVFCARTSRNYETSFLNEGPPTDLERRKIRQRHGAKSYSLANSDFALEGMSLFC